MGFGPDQLRDKALLALEECVQECRFGPARRSFAVRFALAYLWAYAGGEKKAFETFWRVLGDPKSPWSFSAADGALLAIYAQLGLTRDEAVAADLWRRKAAEQAKG